jgi:hypothetical protein
MASSGLPVCLAVPIRGAQTGATSDSPEVRDLIRQMSTANPLWGAPRIHGELLKLGIEVSQATVGRYMPWRPKEPSPTWRSFVQNHVTDIAAVDMFVVCRRPADGQAAARASRIAGDGFQWGPAFARVVGRQDGCDGS